MSRIRVSEVSSPISLFPFIGILLCTMGALLVILVAVSRSAGDSAKREVEARQQSAVAAVESDENRQQLEDVNNYLAKLKSVRGEAEQKLRDEQARLSHLEDHIRRLREQMRSLQAAAGELQSLEEEHYDDRKQAEQEVKRLRELIEESQKTIDSLREQSAKGKHSYALVPYEGPNGTHRRPIYIECADNQLILQPEGIRISSDELVPPFGAGNPLAAALRAARDHLIRLHPNEGQGRDTELYALVLVRPSGLTMFSRARAAIEAGDFDMGYELVESDWKLKYPTSDPTLGGIQQQAIEEALVRQQMLAAAAPRAYRNPALVAAGQFEDEEDSDEPVGRGEADGYVVREKRTSGGDGLGGGDGVSDDNGSGTGGGSGGFPGGGNGVGGYGSSGTAAAGGDGGNGVGGAARGGMVGSSSRIASGSAGAGLPADESAGQIAGHGGGASGNPGGGDGGNGNAGGVASGNTSGAAGNSAASATGVNHGVSGAGTAVGSGIASSAGAAGSVPMSADPDQQQPGNVSIMTGSPPPGSAGSTQGRDPSGHIAGRGELSQSKGKDWALGKKPPRSVPIRRTIHVVVRQDLIAILPENVAPTNSTTGSTVIPIKGDTVEAVDEFVTQVRKLVDSWGIAGDGLYWRPVLQVTVGPEGQRRANDLSRLLKNSGLELRSNDTAQNVNQGPTHETR